MSKLYVHTDFDFIYIPVKIDAIFTASVGNNFYVLQLYMYKILNYFFWKHQRPH